MQTLLVECRWRNIVVNAQELESHRISAVHSFKKFLQRRFEQDRIDTLTAPLLEALIPRSASGAITAGPMLSWVGISVDNTNQLFSGTTHESFGLPEWDGIGYRGFLYTDKFANPLYASHFWTRCDDHIMATIFMDSFGHLMPIVFTGESVQSANGSGGGSGFWTATFRFDIP